MKHFKVNWVFSTDDVLSLDDFIELLADWADNYGFEYGGGQCELDDDGNEIKQS